MKKIALTLATAAGVVAFSAGPGVRRKSHKRRRQRRWSCIVQLARSNAERFEPDEPDAAGDEHADERAQRGQGRGKHVGILGTVTLPPRDGC